MALSVHSVGHGLARPLGEKVLVKSRVRKIRSRKDLAIKVGFRLTVVAYI